MTPSHPDKPSWRRLRRLALVAALAAQLQFFDNVIPGPGRRSDRAEKESRAHPNAYVHDNVPSRQILPRREPATRRGLPSVGGP